MNNYNKIEKAKNDLNAYLKRLDNYKGSIHPEAIKTFLKGVIETLEA